MGLASGAVLLNLLLALFGMAGRGAPWLAIVSLVVAAALKWLYWLAIDGEAREYTIEAATGLGHLGKVRALEPPHTQPNFIMREMGYRVARKHAERLRKLALLLAFAVPIAMLLLSQVPGAWPCRRRCSPPCRWRSACSIERWLFFAEAEHVSMLYYGADVGLRGRAAPHPRRFPRAGLRRCPDAASPPASRRCRRGAGRGG